ncbi:MAG: NAD(P)-binding domain-containing protein, partial [Pirellulales bacterium]|nr:NAD(P)-binding domain-containing protein [Pirellulales bacterium]
MPPSSSFQSLETRIRDNEVIVAVVGLGYVGLPLVDAFVRAGIRAIGYDVDQQKIDKLNRGESYIGHIPTEKLRHWLEKKLFVATSDTARLVEADAILVCVPTPLTESRDPDLSYVISTFQQIAKILRPGQLIILESTTYPGTTRDVVLPELAKSGLQVGSDYFLAYSPEREDPGNPDFSA